MCLTSLKPVSTESTGTSLPASTVTLRSISRVFAYGCRGAGQDSSLVAMPWKVNRSEIIATEFVFFRFNRMMRDGSESNCPTIRAVTPIGPQLGFESRNLSRRVRMVFISGLQAEATKGIVAVAVGGMAVASRSCFAPMMFGSSRRASKKDYRARGH
jgi:hypothetical protein